MYDITQFRELIVQPALKAIDAYSEEAEELLIMTCAHLSLGGTYFKQIDGGSAIGAFQMEEATYNDIWNNFLKYRLALYTKVLKAVNMTMPPPFSYLMHDVFFATIMARVYYIRFRESIPHHSDVQGLADYYKKYWNTKVGDDVVEDVIKNYKEFADKK